MWNAAKYKSKQQLIAGRHSASSTIHHRTHITNIIRSTKERLTDGDEASHEYVE
jgi:hypothetical protein